jgi:hypothetical protein
VCAAVDVHYLSTGGAQAAAVLAADATFAHVLAERTAVLSRVPLYYLQQTLAYSPVLTGLAFLPMVGMLMICANLATIVLMPGSGPGRWSPSACSSPPAAWPG